MANRIVPPTPRKAPRVYGNESALDSANLHLEFAKSIANILETRLYAHRADQAFDDVLQHTMSTLAACLVHHINSAQDAVNEPPGERMRTQKGRLSAVPS